MNNVRQGSGVVMNKGNEAMAGQEVSLAALTRLECGRVFDLGPVTISTVREAVAAAVQYWPNAHLGEVSPRDDMQSAFRRIRCNAASGMSVRQAAVRVLDDAYRHMDM